jgi:hypothetical protein
VAPRGGRALDAERKLVCEAYVEHAHGWRSSNTRYKATPSTRRCRIRPQVLPAFQPDIPNRVESDLPAIVPCVQLAEQARIAVPCLRTAEISGAACRPDREVRAVARGHGPRGLPEAAEADVGLAEEVTLTRKK